MAKKSDTLIFIPTYNEHNNVKRIYRDIKDLGIEADMLFIDDNSPDGTGAVIDDLAKADNAVHVIHRMGKMGIGSAHLKGIGFAYENGYKTLITMDCDLTHKADNIKDFIDSSEGYDIVLGSRYMKNESLKEWNFYRRFLTHLGHFLTKSLLGVPQDATGAYRLYKLNRIDQDIFKDVGSSSYSFFFESLYMLAQHKYKIKEIPIELPKRCYGHSKMRMADIARSIFKLIDLYFRTIFRGFNRDRNKR